MDTEAPKRRGDAKERILQLAEAAVLEKGFAGTSIDELIAAAGITKSGFFYHFKDKTELARVLLLRYIAREDELFDDLFARADELNDDPLHGFLVGLKLLAELTSELPTGHPGCLVVIRIASLISRCAISTRRRCSPGVSASGIAWI